MIKSNPLTFELDAGPDDQGVFRIFPELRMNPLAHIIQGRAGGQDQWMLHVGATISWFQVDPDKIKRRPYSIPENFHVNIFLCRQWNIVAQLLLCGTKVFLVDQVNLVQNRQGRNISSIPCHYIDQLIVRNVVSNDDTSVRYSVDLHDPLDRFLVEPRQLYRAGNGGFSFFCPCDYNIWPPLIQTYTHRLKLVPQQLDLTWLEYVPDEKNYICIPCDGEGTPSPSL